MRRLFAIRSFHSSGLRCQTEDLYSVLGVNKTASSDDIKKAYHKLALKYHPDRTKGDKDAEKKFAQINAAYDVLKDNKKRNQYDQFGMTGEGAPEFGEGIDLNDLFEGIFGGARGASGGAGQVDHSGGDIEITQRISFMDAVKGTDKGVQFSAYVPCQPCNGSGAAPGSKIQQCSKCGGRGVETIQAGFFPMATACRACGGEGRIITTPCTNCKSTGRVRDRKNLTVKIPAGVEDGQSVRVTSAGDAGTRGGQAGHLFIRVSVAQDPVFRREKQHIHVEVPVTLAEAVLGGTVRVPTLDGEVEVKIPAGMPSGETRVLKGRGFSVPGRPNSAKGNLYIHFIAHVPKNISAEQRAIIEKFGEEEKNNGDYRKLFDALFVPR